MSVVEVPASVRVWQIGVDAANVLSWNNYQHQQGYHLYCTTNGKFLTYEDVSFGINLDFKSAGDNKTHFRLPDGQEREVLSGELVALGIGGSPSFLYYKEQSVGINLAYAEKPMYEWKIFGADGQLGQPIPENSPVALMNVKVEPEPDFLVNFDRQAGSDIGWTSSPGFWDVVADVIDEPKVKAAIALIATL
jgi:hypothetical protein